MAIQKINLGTEPHGVGGDSYRTANEKINSNFEEVGKDIKDVLDVVMTGDFSKTAYDIAVKNGFVGSESEWLESLRGEQGPEAKSVYDIAVSHGFKGNEEDWLNYILENSETVTDLFADADSLEQFVNGSDSETVMTRLNAEYPTLQKALKELFENGGLPATPFKTKALMEASALVDGDYAMVTNDTDDLNGLYIKDGSDWIQPSYAKALKDISNLSGKVQIEKGSNLVLRPSEEGLITYDYPNTPEGEEIGYQFARTAPLGAFPKGRSYVIEVKPNTTYTLRCFSSSAPTTFRMLATKGEPIKLPTASYSRKDAVGRIIYYDGFATSSSSSNRDKVTQYTFTTEDDETHIVFNYYLDGELRDPKVRLVEGTVNNAYDHAYYVSNVKQASSLNDLPFLVNNSKNLFDGVYQSGTMFLGDLIDPDTIPGYYRKDFDKYKGNMAIIKVEPNTQYTISTPDYKAFDRFRVALHRTYPSMETTEPLDKVLIWERKLGFAFNKPYTFTTEDSTQYVVVYASALDRRPPLQLEKGGVATSYVGYPKLNESLISPKNLPYVRSSNLFEGTYEDLALTADPEDPSKYTISKAPNDRSNKVAIVSIKANTYYTISFQDELTRGTSTITYWENYPSIELDNSGVLLVEGTVFKGYVVEPREQDGYLVIESSTIGISRRLQVEEGTEATDYKEFMVISPSKLPDIGGGASSNSSIFKPKNSFIFNAPLYQGVYLRERELEDYFSQPRLVQYSEIYARYDAIKDSLPEGFMTKRVLGQDAWGNDIVEYETHPSKLYKVPDQYWADNNPANVALKQPTFYITSGVHGDEKSAVYGTLYGLREILLNPMNDNLMDYIRRTVKFIFTPICNPSGFNAQTRTNKNNNNLNRDFPFLGKVTQKETSILVEALSSRAGYMDYHIDMHTGAAADPRMLGYLFCDDKQLEFVTANMYQELGRNMQSKYSGISQDPFHRWVYTATTIEGSMSRYVQDAFKVRSIIAETRNNISGISNTWHHEENVILSSEIFVNTIINFMKCLQNGSN